MADTITPPGSSVSDLFEPVPQEETPLADAFRDSLFGGEDALRLFVPFNPANRRDAMLTLERIYDLSRGPLPAFDGEARYAHHPDVASLRWSLESSWLSVLEREEVSDEMVSDAVNALVTIGTSGAPAYQRLEHDPSWETAAPLVSHSLLVAELFDSLPRRLEDVVGRPLSTPVRQHQDLATALSLPELPDQSRPTELVALSALAGLLTLNHWLAPEALGALSAHLQLRANRIEVERTALESLGAPAQALAAMRPETTDVLVDVIEPVLADRPEWTTRVLRGALWYAGLDADLNA